MNKSQLENYITQGYSTNQISKATKKSQTNVRYWLAKFNLKTIHKSFKEQPPLKNIQLINGEEFKTCPQCNKIKNVKSEYYINKQNKIHGWCKSCNNQITYQKQLDRKAECVKYKGGKCFVCGYNKYIGSLDFHHLNPSQKEFNISNLRSYKFSNIKNELDKCVLLCKNCHAEVHHGLINLSKLN